MMMNPRLRILLGISSHWGLNLSTGYLRYPLIVRYYHGEACKLPFCYLVFVTAH